MLIECTYTIIDRFYGLDAHRQFIHWTYSELGRMICRVIPLCVVAAVYHEFPEDDGMYIDWVALSWQNCSFTLLLCPNKSHVLYNYNVLILCFKTVI